MSGACGKEERAGETGKGEVRERVRLIVPSVSGSFSGRCWRLGPERPERQHSVYRGGRSAKKGRERTLGGEARRVGVRRKSFHCKTLTRRSMERTEGAEKESVG